MVDWALADSQSRRETTLKFIPWKKQLETTLPTYVNINGNSQRIEKGSGMIAYVLNGHGVKKTVHLEVDF